MFKKKNKKIKGLPCEYNYYESVKIKTEKLYYKYFSNNTSRYNEYIVIEKLYNLVLNICNQEIYDCVYTFTKDDLYFIADYNINICSLIKVFIEDIEKMKKVNDMNMAS